MNTYHSIPRIAIICLALTIVGNGLSASEAADPESLPSQGASPTESANGDAQSSMILVELSYKLPDGWTQVVRVLENGQLESKEFTAFGRTRNRKVKGLTEGEMARLREMMDQLIAHKQSASFVKIRSNLLFQSTDIAPMAALLTSLCAGATEVGEADMRTWRELDSAEEGNE